MPKEEYKVPVKIGQLKKQQVVAMHIMAALLFMVMGFLTFITPTVLALAQDSHLAIYEGFDNQQLINYLGLGISAVGIVIFVLVFKLTGNQSSSISFTLRIVEIITFLLIIVYCLLQKWYLPLAFSLAGLGGVIFAYLWERYNNKPKSVIVSGDGVLVPSFSGGRLIKWASIQRLLVRHGILTIDLRENKLYQFVLQQEVVNKEEIEQFSQNSIHANQHLAQQDW